MKIKIPTIEEWSLFDRRKKLHEGHPRILVVRLACDYAMRSLKFCTDEQKRSEKAIEVALDWTRTASSASSASSSAAASSSASAYSAASAAYETFRRQVANYSRCTRLFSTPAGNAIQSHLDDTNKHGKAVDAFIHLDATMRLRRNIIYRSAMEEETLNGFGVLADWLDERGDIAGAWSREIYSEFCL